MKCMWGPWSVGRHGFEVVTSRHVQRFSDDSIVCRACILCSLKHTSGDGEYSWTFAQSPPRSQCMSPEYLSLPVKRLEMVWFFSQRSYKTSPFNVTPLWNLLDPFSFNFEARATTPHKAEDVGAQSVLRRSRGLGLDSLDSMFSKESLNRCLDFVGIVFFSLLSGGVAEGHRCTSIYTH